MTRPSFEDFKKEALTQPGVRRDYERLAPAFRAAQKTNRDTLGSRVYTGTDG